MNRIIAKIKQIKVTPKFVLKVFFYLFLHFLYHLCEYGNQWAGSLRGGIKNIPQVARIIAVTDDFDAMSSTRSYRKKLPLDFIAQEIEKCTGTQFDPEAAKALLELYKEGAFDHLKEKEE